MAVEQLDITRVFMCGRSQAVRIPAHYHIDATTVVIRRSGDSIILTPRHDETSWSDFFETPICEDFLAERDPVMAEFSSQEVF